MQNRPSKYGIQSIDRFFFFALSAIPPFAWRTSIQYGFCSILNSIVCVHVFPSPFLKWNWIFYIFNIDELVEYELGCFRCTLYKYILLHYFIVSILSQTHDNKRNNRHVYLYLYICALFNVYCFVSFRFVCNVNFSMYA